MVIKVKVDTLILGNLTPGYLDRMGTSVIGYLDTWTLGYLDIWVLGY